MDQRVSAGSATTPVTRFEVEEARNYMFQLLSVMADAGGSDLFIAKDFPPAMKMHGNLVQLTDQRLPSEVCKLLVESVMTRQQREEFERELECNFAISVPGLARFRVNVFLNQQHPAMVMRTIPAIIPDIESLGLPDALKDIVETKRGLVLVVGATGSGKSTALAAMINHRNRNSTGHIITVEDPVEFVHPSVNCLVTHREVGIDTLNWHNALKNTLRQAPDVILIGEIRDRETMEHAIAFSETGHLCLGTLHANNASQAMDRIVNFFPEERRPQILMDLSSNLKAIVSQRLVRTQDGDGRKAAVEILINTPTIAERLLNGEFQGLRDIMAKSRELGMRTFDWALFELYTEGHISYDEALRNADSVNDLRLAIKLKSSRGEPKESTSLLLKVEEDEILTPEEVEAQRRKELARQAERKKRLERERLEAEIARDRLRQERRRQKEDEELRRLQLEKCLRLEEGVWSGTGKEPDRSPA